MEQNRIGIGRRLPRKADRRTFDIWDTFTSMAKSGVSLPLLFTPQLVSLGTELTRIVSGQSTIEPSKDDNRFEDPTWLQNPIYKASMQTYLAWCQHLHGLVDEVALNKADEAQAKAAIKLLTDSLSPTHSANNIEAVRRAVKARGASLVHGLNRMTSDVLELDLENSTGENQGKGLKPGKDIATTPGAVIFRNEQLELIQYRATTPRVCCEPILLIPSPVNRFYIYDLYPHNSLVHYLLEAGFQVFTISWRNPTYEHRHWDLETYLAALVETSEIVAAVTDNPNINLFGYSAGGILAALLANQLAHHQELHSHTAGFAVTNFYTQTQTQIGIMVNRQIIQAAKTLLNLRTIVDGKELAGMFAWLRPNNLLWNAWICNYFDGEDQPTTDVRHWNNDAPRIANALFADFLDLYTDNHLIERGNLKLCGSPVDLSLISCDKFIVAGASDHISPWECCYQSSLALGKNREFILVNRGHMRSLVCPEGSKAARYYTNPSADENYDDWLAEAGQHQGSWWSHWTEWLSQRSNSEKKAPAQLGNKMFPELAPAPGTYVLE